MDPRCARYSVTIENRMDSHYPNDVLPGGTSVELFGVASTKMAMMLDGAIGFMRAFGELEFVAPAYQGDFVRVTAQVLTVGRTSRRRSYEAYVAPRVYGMSDNSSHREVLDEPILIARGVGVAVTPLESQRRTPAECRPGQP
ncbi:hotdog fold domain-containing protein [Sphingomonas oligophenolica]